MLTAHRAPVRYKLLTLLAGIMMALAMLSPYADAQRLQACAAVAQPATAISLSSSTFAPVHRRVQVLGGNASPVGARQGNGSPQRGR